MKTVIPVELPNVFDINDETADPTIMDVLESYRQKVEEMSHGFLQSNVVHSRSVEQELLQFEIKVPSRDFSSVLFEIRHRTGIDYPAVIDPPARLPKYLRKKPSITIDGSASDQKRTDEMLDRQADRIYNQPRIAESYPEFSRLVREIFKSPEVTSVIANLRQSAKAME